MMCCFPSFIVGDVFSDVEHAVIHLLFGWCYHLTFVFGTSPSCTQYTKHREKAVAAGTAATIKEKKYY